MGIFVGGADKKKNTKTRAPLSKGSPGFTLFELVVVMLIASILFAVATPSFSEFRLNSRMTSAANNLLAAVQVARTEAAKRQQAVSVCALQNPPAGTNSVCSGAPLSAVGAQGWLVFVDPNRDCARVVGDVVISVSSRANADDGITSQAAGNCVTFGPNGFLVQPDVAVLLCDRRGMGTDPENGLTYARGVALSPSGSARITRDFVQIRDTLRLACP
jgi:type IV fimbrial biogenesis protein FimT